MVFMCSDKTEYNTEGVSYKTGPHLNRDIKWWPGYWPIFELSVLAPETRAMLAGTENEPHRLNITR